MEKRTNAVTKVEARYKDEPYFEDTGVASNEEFYNGAANDNDFNDSEEEMSPSRVQNVSTRYSKRFNERGVAKDIYEKTRKKVEGEELRQAEALRRQRVNSTNAAASQAALKTKQVVTTAKKARGLIGWGMLAPVAIAYIWQLTFGIISLVGFGAFAAILEFNQTTAGKIISWFVDLNSFIPADMLGFAFWALTALLATAVFVGCVLVFYLTGINAFATSLSLLIAFVALALSMLPVINLLPWLLLWVLYVRATATVALFRG